MIEIFGMLIEMLDPMLIFWALVLNVIGFHLKRTPLPEWLPPIPLTLYIIALIPCFALGLVTAEGDGGRAALTAAMYGLSNAGLITLPAIWGYDIVHAFTGKKAKDVAYVWTLADKAGISKKLKSLVYSLSGGVALIGAGVLAYLLGETPGYAICWAFFGAGTALIIARQVTHLVKRDFSAETWAVTIFALVAMGGWLGLILTTSWLWVSVFGAMLVGCAIMAAGVRFMDQKKEEKSVMVIPPPETGDLLAFFKANLKYRFSGDSMDNPLDPDRPLCSVGEMAMTCEEADAAGFGAIAAEGIEYIKEIIRKKEGE